MARDYTSRRLKAWVALLAIPGMRESMLRQLGTDFRRAEIDRAAEAFGLALTDTDQVRLLLGIACECLFPTLSDNPFECIEYRKPSQMGEPLTIWTSGRYRTSGLDIP
jgi:hypothetical protein